MRGHFVSSNDPDGFARATPLRPIYLRQHENPEMYYTEVSTLIKACPQIGTRSLLDRECQYGDVCVQVPPRGEKSVPVPALGRCQHGGQHM